MPGCLLAQGQEPIEPMPKQASVQDRCAYKARLPSAGVVHNGLL